MACDESKPTFHQSINNSLRQTQLCHGATGVYCKPICYSYGSVSLYTVAVG